MMSEPREMYDRCRLHGLKSDVAMMQRHIHHELDNYKIDMSQELIEILEELEKSLKVANDNMKKIKV